MYHLMKKLTSFFVGFMSAMITLDLAILSAVSYGSVRYISWMAFFAALCFTAAGKEQARQSQKGGETICGQIKRAIQRGR